MIDQRSDELVDILQRDLSIDLELPADQLVDDCMERRPPIGRLPHRRAHAVEDVQAESSALRITISPPTFRAASRGARAM